MTPYLINVKQVIHDARKGISKGFDRHISQNEEAENYNKNKVNPNAIFIWIPKTAGTSLYTSMIGLGAQKLLTLDAIKQYPPRKGIFTFGHLSLKAMLSEKHIDEEFYQSAWKFSFVRNPFDRAVSLYAYLIKTKTLPPKTPFPLFCRYISEGLYEPIGLYNRRGLNQVNPQSEWLFDGQTKLYDSVFKYEDLAVATKEVASKLKLTTHQFEVGKLNTTTRNHISTYYSPEEVRVIQKAYESDFVNFCYDPNPYW